MTTRLAPTDTIGYGSTADLLCKVHADHEGVTSKVTRADLAALGIAEPACDACGTILANGTANRTAATADVIDAARAVFGADVNADWMGTGGGCMAVCITFEDGTYIYVTNADASLPDGFDLGAGFYNADGEFERDLFEGGHDIVALSAALAAVKGA